MRQEQRHRIRTWSEKWLKIIWGVTFAASVALEFRFMGAEDYAFGKLIFPNIFFGVCMMATHYIRYATFSNHEKWRTSILGYWFWLFVVPLCVGFIGCSAAMKPAN